MSYLLALLKALLVALKQLNNDFGNIVSASVAAFAAWLAVRAVSESIRSRVVSGLPFFVLQQCDDQPSPTLSFDINWCSPGQFPVFTNPIYLELNNWGNGHAIDVSLDYFGPVDKVGWTDSRMSYERKGRNLVLDVRGFLGKPVPYAGVSIATGRRLTIGINVKFTGSSPVVGHYALEVYFRSLSSPERRLFVAILHPIFAELPNGNVVCGFIPLKAVHIDNPPPPGMKYGPNNEITAALSAPLIERALAQLKSWLAARVFGRGKGISKPRAQRKRTDLDGDQR